LDSLSKKKKEPGIWLVRVIAM